MIDIMFRVAGIRGSGRGMLSLVVAGDSARQLALENDALHDHPGREVAECLAWHAVRGAYGAAPLPLSDPWRGRGGPRLQVPHVWVKRVSQGVADEIEREHRDEDGDARGE